MELAAGPSSPPPVPAAAPAKVATSAPKRRRSLFGLKADTTAQDNLDRDRLTEGMFVATMDVVHRHSRSA